MTAPTTVFVPLQHDSAGLPRGFEKGPGRYHLDEAAAEEANKAMPTGAVVECVIMGKTEYDAIVAELTTLKNAVRSAEQRMTLMIEREQHKLLDVVVRDELRKLL